LLRPPQRERALAHRDLEGPEDTKVHLHARRAPVSQL
jgi:hypothetical protein